MSILILDKLSTYDEDEEAIQLNFGSAEDSYINSIILEVKMLEDFDDLKYSSKEN